jgi:5-epi-alpha-selinene synthase
VSLAYPAGELHELTIINDFCAYLFFNDDQAEEDVAFGKNPERLRRFLDAHLTALRSGRDTNPEDPLNAFLIDIRRRILERGSEAWLERFAFDVEQYLMQGTYVGALHWTRASVPSIAAYHNQRLYDSALFPAQDLIELAERIQLSDDTIRSPEIVELRCICNHVVAFTNDLFSYAKEVVKFESPNNLVHVIMAGDRVDLEEAASRVVDTIHRKIVQFIDVKDDLMATALPPGVDRYVAGLESWMRGNLVWSLETGRYTPDAPAHGIDATTTAEASSSRMGAGWR